MGTGATATEQAAPSQTPSEGFLSLLSDIDDDEPQNAPPALAAGASGSAPNATTAEAGSNKGGFMELLGDIEDDDEDLPAT